MATKIDDLTAASALDGTEGLHAVQGGNSRLTTALDVAETLVTSGSWTPVVSDGTNTNATYAIQHGRYIKIGPLVTVFGHIKLATLGSVSGSLIITGLPFVSANTAQSQSSVHFGFGGALNLASGDTVCGFIGQNISEITLEVWDSVSGVGGLTSTLLSADGQLLFSGSYET